MGAWVTKPKKPESNVVSLSELNDPPMKQINDVNDLVISQGDFVLEKNGRFRDSYQIGPTLGSGSFGEVRKCK